MADNEDFGRGESGERDPFGDDWMPTDFEQALKGEKELHPDEDPETTARRLLRENVGGAVMQIARAATHGATDRIRLEASKYIVERVLGRVGDDSFDGIKSPVESFIDDVIEYAHAVDGNQGEQ